MYVEVTAPNIAKTPIFFFQILGQFAEFYLNSFSGECELYQCLLSHPNIPGVTLCFCTGSYTASAATATGRRFFFTQ